MLTSKYKYYVSASASVPVGSWIPGTWAPGLQVGREKRVLRIFSFAQELGGHYLFPKDYVSNGITYNRKAITETYLQLGLKLPAIRGFRLGAYWGYHVAMEDGKFRKSSDYTEHFNDYTLQLSFSLIRKLEKVSPISMAVFYSHFKSNGDNLNLAGLKLRVTIP